MRRSELKRRRRIPILELLSRSFDTAHRRERLARSHLYVIVDQGLVKGSNIPDPAQELAVAGADLLQIRANDIPAREHFRLAVQCIQSVRSASETLVIVNNNPEVALESGADGVHLGAKDMPIPRARRLLGERRIIGATTHNASDARAAASNGADYLSYGPVFASRLKAELSPRGDSYLASIKRTGLPFFAIGGITLSKVDELVRRGVRQVAVCSAVLEASDPVQAVRKFKRALGR